MNYKVAIMDDNSTLQIFDNRYQKQALQWFSVLDFSRNWTYQSDNIHFEIYSAQSLVMIEFRAPVIGHTKDTWLRSPSMRTRAQLIRPLSW